MAIPLDLKKYLENSASRKIRFRFGEVREIELFSADELDEKVFDVQTSHYYLNGEYPEDDNAKFEYRGLDLVKSCSGYSPVGVLIWFVDLSSYGSWDCDHHTIMTFPEVTWSEILEEPDIYFNAQWYPRNVDHEYLKPWRKY